MFTTGVFEISGTKGQLLALLAIFIAASSQVLADGDHDHTGKHGGTIVETNRSHLEGVISDGHFALYIDDNNHQPKNLAGVKATAVVLSSGQTVNMTLIPNSGGFHADSDAFKVNGVVVIITLTPKDGPVELVRFEY